MGWWGESKFFGRFTKDNGSGNSQYPGQQPGDIPDWNTRYEYDFGREVFAPDGNYYRCIEDHVANDFATDLANGKWEIFAGPGINTDDQVLSLDPDGTTLRLSGGIVPDSTVDLSSFVVAPQTLSFVGTILSISDGNSVDLISLLDNTDNQTLSLSGNILSIAGGNSVDLTAFANVPTNLSYTSSPTNGTVNSDTGTDAVIPLADPTNAGLQKPYSGIATDVLHGDGSWSTPAVPNLSYTSSPTNGVVTNAAGTGFMIPLVTVSNAGLISPADKTKLNTYPGTYIAPSTNLSYTASATNGIVVSDTGNDATITLVDVTNAGLMSPANFSKLATYPSVYSAPDGSETKLTAGTNTTITGSGTIASPYVINSTTQVRNLGYTASPTNGTVTIDGGGTNSVLPLATTTNAGLLSPADKLKIDNMVKFFNNAGTEITNMRPRFVNVTTDASSVFTFNATSMGYTTVYAAVIQSIESFTSLGELKIQALNVLNSTTITGRCMESNNTTVVLGGNIEGLELAGAGISVTIVIWGA